MPVFPAAKKKSDYESIPNVDGDVESPPPPAALLQGVAPSTATSMMDPAKATELAKKQYSELELDDDQARLVGMMDQVRTHASLDLDLPSCISSLPGNTSTWMDQALDFLMGLIEPTVTAIVTASIALFLQAQQRAIRAQDDLEEQTGASYEYIMAIIIIWFPYINATLVFIATVRPLQERIMTSLVRPVFQAMAQAEQVLQTTVQRLGPFVDETIDGIQQDFHTVVKPIQPTLDQLQNNAQLMEQVMEHSSSNNNKEDKNVDIPDPSDIDRELDEAQGVVKDRIQEAQGHLEFEHYVPLYLSSPRQFYWRIIVPILVLAWMLQMAVAFGTAYLQQQYHYDDHYSNVTANAIIDEHNHIHNNNERFLLSQSRFNSFHDDTRKHSEQQERQLGLLVLDSVNMNVTDQWQEDADKSQKHYTNLVNDTFHSLQKNLTDEVHAIQEDLKNEYQQYKDEVEKTVLENKQYLLQNVLWSYAMALAQMLLMYLLTNPTVQAWVVRQGLKQIQTKAERTLEEYGVAVAFEQVLDERMGRVREKVLQLLRIYKKVQAHWDKAQAMADSILPGGTAEMVQDAIGGGSSSGGGTATGAGEAVQDAVKAAKKKPFFKRMFKK